MCARAGLHVRNVESLWRAVLAGRWKVGEEMYVRRCSLVRTAVILLVALVGLAGSASADGSARATSATFVCELTALHIGQSTACTVTITDTAPAPARAPTGTVTVGGHRNDGIAGSPCALVPTGDGVSSSCKVTYTPVAPGLGSRAITAWYHGDRSHSGSHATASISVPPLAPSLNGVTMNCGIDCPPFFGGGSCADPSLGFSNGLLALGMLAPNGDIGGTVQRHGNRPASGQFVFHIADNAGRPIVRGVLSFDDGSFFCEPSLPGADLSESNFSLGASFTYHATIFTAYGPARDAGTGYLEFDYSWFGGHGGTALYFKSGNGPLGLVIDHRSFAGNPDLALNGSAEEVGGALELTDGGAGEAGSVWAAQYVWPEESFSTTLGVGNSSPDGFVFVIQRAPARIRALGSELGYAGISPSVAVYFDTATTTVSVYENGTLVAVSPSPFQTNFDPSGPFNIGYNANTHELDISDAYSGGNANFGGVLDYMNVPIDLTSVLGTNKVLVGVTASSTSAGTASTVLDSWQLRAPIP